MKAVNNNMHQSLGIILSLVFMLVSGMNAAHARADDMPVPQKLIVDNTGKLINGLVNKRDAIKTDRAIADQLVSEYVLPFIDFERASRLVLGKHWRRANDDQRARFTHEFATFLTNNYTTAMVEFTDEIVNNSRHLDYLPLRGADDKYADVRMEIKLPNRQPLQVEYSLFNTENGWKVYDISIEGVSLATTYRSQFSSEIRRSGLENLISRLAERNLKRAEKTAAAGNEQTP